MNSIKQITVTGYTVEFVDLREPKPRTIRKETAVYDAATIAAARTLGISLTAHIRQRYEQGGYHVLTISKESSRQITVDIGALYQLAAQSESNSRTEGQAYE